LRLLQGWQYVGVIGITSLSTSSGQTGITEFFIIKLYFYIFIPQNFPVGLARNASLATSPAHSLLFYNTLQNVESRIWKRKA